MFRPLELFIGLRYTRAKRRNHFISFISLISMLGIVVGMTALITVLSVMNGFQQEVRTRMLSVVSHVQISGDDNTLHDWRSLTTEVSKNQEVQATAPFVQAQGLLSYSGIVRGVMIRGVIPDEENKVDDIGKQMKLGTFADL